MQIVVNNYHNNDLSWLKSDDLIVYDKKDKNVGSNIYDYFDYIIKNYDNLPDVIMFTKGNMLERHITPEEFEKVRHNTTLTPLLTMNHKTEMPVCYYEDGLYYEINNYWYKHEHLVREEVFNWLKWYLKIEDKKYLGFAPGACWIVPRENILKNSLYFYMNLKDAVSHDGNPAEAHLIERSLYYIWS
jgi:hypothetical protein